MPVYADRPDDDVNQGDIFEAVPFPVGRVDGAATLGMVISHDCDADKFLKPKTPLTEAESAAFAVTVAHVHPITELTGGRPKAARQGGMPRYFYLLAERDLPELVVDLWTGQPVRLQALLNCDRKVSLSPETRYDLWWKIIRLRLGRDFQRILRGENPDLDEE